MAILCKHNRTIFQNCAECETEFPSPPPAPDFADLADRLAEALRTVMNEHEAYIGVQATGPIWREYHVLLAEHAAAKGKP